MRWAAGRKGDCTLLPLEVRPAGDTACSPSARQHSSSQAVQQAADARSYRLGANEPDERHCCQPRIYAQDCSNTGSCILRIRIWNCAPECAEPHTAKTQRSQRTAGHDGRKLGINGWTHLVGSLGVTRSVPLVQRNPHALHRLFGPEGPERQSGVFVEPQCSHWFTPPLPSTSRRNFGDFGDFGDLTKPFESGTGRRMVGVSPFRELGREGPGLPRASRTIPRA